MKSSGEKEDFTGRVLDCDQLAAMASNLSSGKTGPVTVFEHAQGVANLRGFIPAGTQNNSQIKIINLRLPADLFDELVGRIASFKAPGCFGHGLVAHVV